MAVQVAAIAAGAGAVAAAAAGPAEAAAAPATGLDRVELTTDPMQVQGWSCWGGPISRGPLAPPALGEDELAALLAEVPA